MNGLNGQIFQHVLRPVVIESKEEQDTNINWKNMAEPHVLVQIELLKIVISLVHQSSVMEVRRQILGSFIMKVTTNALTSMISTTIIQSPSSQ